MATYIPSLATYEILCTTVIAIDLLIAACNNNLFTKKLIQKNCSDTQFTDLVNIYTPI